MFLPLSPPFSSMHSRPAMALLSLLALTPLMISAAAQEPAALTLNRMVETRINDLRPPADDEMMAFGSFDAPGLTLTFALRLPPGAQVMELRQPKNVVATDSAGTDLSKIEPGFRDELEYVELEHDFKDDDETSEITLHLALPARAAATIDVATTFEAIIFTGTKSQPIEAGKDWLPLAVEGLPPGQQPRVRVAEDGLEFQPSEIESWIESVEIQTGPNDVAESNGWFSDGSSITYMFDEMPEGRPLKATMMLRTGVKSMPLTIALKGQPLP